MPGMGSSMFYRHDLLILHYAYGVSEITPFYKRASELREFYIISHLP